MTSEHHDPAHGHPQDHAAHGDAATAHDLGDVHDVHDVDMHDDVDLPDEDLHDAYQPAIDATWTEPVPVPVTGDPRVDDALTLLAGLGEVDVHEHAPVLQEVHDRLRAVLVDGAGVA